GPLGSGSWDCEVCLVQNKADSTKCIACESAKPGT
nr:Chain B, Nuclear pore complex protein Nup153 [Rattus norvegicus]3GJ5_D Chain D, Nuclear pore complex protein Nup153 [Rattus norvegicus]